MTLAVLQELAVLGVGVTVDGTELVLDGSRGVLTRDLIERVRRAKSAIVVDLTGRWTTANVRTVEDWLETVEEVRTGAMWWQGLDAEGRKDWAESMLIRMNDLGITWRVFSSPLMAWLEQVKDGHADAAPPPAPAWPLEQIPGWTPLQIQARKWRCDVMEARDNAVWFENMTPTRRARWARTMQRVRRELCIGTGPETKCFLRRLTSN